MRNGQPIGHDGPSLCLAGEESSLDRRLIEGRIFGRCERSQSPKRIVAREPIFHLGGSERE